MKSHELAYQRMKFRLRLTTRRCPDGVESFGPAARDGAPSMIRYRSNRQQLLVRERVNLENAIVVQFANATTQQKLLDFLGAFGLLKPTVQAREKIMREQYLLRGFLERAGSGDVAKATLAANAMSASFTFAMRPTVEPNGNTPRLVLTAHDLLSFMRMEIAVVAANCARLAKCQFCRDLFLTGRGTAGRATARFCRTHCRVKAHRAKLKMGGRQHVSQKTKMGNRKRRSSRSLGR